MWIFSKHGFYSIVAHREVKGCYLVRSRVVEDLNNLRQAVGLNHCRVRRTPEADYPFRILVDTAAMDRIMAALSDSIDYPNFKAAVHGDELRDEAYADVHRRMAQFGYERTGQ